MKWDQVDGAASGALVAGSSSAALAGGAASEALVVGSSMILQSFSESPKGGGLVFSSPFCSLFSQSVIIA